MNNAEKIAVLRTAFVAMLPQLRLADLHMGLMNHVSLENKARIALERSGDDPAGPGKRCEESRATGAVHCSDLEDKLHAAICQAVSILNLAPEISGLREGRQVSAILRQALADYADDFMNKPAREKGSASTEARAAG